MECKLLTIPFSLLLVCVSCANNQSSESNNKESERVIVVDENDAEYQQFKNQLKVESKYLKAERERKEQEQKAAEIQSDQKKSLQGQWEEERIREAAKIDQKQKKIDIRKERQNPADYIELKTETVKTERLFTNKYTIYGQMISKAKYGSYSPVWLKVSYYSKNNILLGSENVRLNICVSHKYEIFSFRIKPPKRTDHYKCEVYNAIWEEFDI